MEDWILSRMPPDASNWYIYFGTIPPDKLELNLTRELALAGLEYQIEQTNYAGFVELRTQIAATEPGTIINPILEDGARAQFSRWRSREMIQVPLLGARLPLFMLRPRHGRVVP